MRYTAAMAVGAIGPDAAEAIPALIVLLDEPNLYVRQVAPRALGAIGSAAKPALPALCRALRDKEWLIRTGAAEAIFKVEPRVVAECAVVPTLEELLEHPDPMARGEAKRILGELWRSGHVEPPNPALQRTRPAVPAGHATSSLGGPVR